MNWLRKHKNAILITTVVGFIVSTFVGFGLYVGTGMSTTDAVVEVNDEDVPYRHFQSIYNRVISGRRDKGEDMSADTLTRIKQDVVQNLVRDAVLYQEARRYGIEVSDVELAQALSQIPAFQKEGKFSMEAYAQTLNFALKTTPEDFEEMQRRQIAITRLQAFVTQGIKITDKEVEREYAIQAAQPKDPKAPKTPKKDPRTEMEELREKLRQEKGAHIFNRWFQQLSTNLKVKDHLPEIERRRGG